MWSRRIELVCAVLSGAFGLAALGVGLFAPLGIQCSGPPGPSNTGGCLRVSLVQVQGLGSLSFAITLFGGLSVGIVLFAVWHGLSRQVPALVLLWTCTGLLYLATLLAMLSIGLLFLPADALALVAGVAGSVAQSATPLNRGTVPM
jgi:hypothetical protein